jgi:hypothetical protein
MIIQSIGMLVFAVFLFMGINVSRIETGQEIKVSVASLAVPNALSEPLICECSVADTADKADKADKAYEDAKDAKDSADKTKADIDADEHATKEDKNDADDKVTKADKDAKDAKDAKDEADKSKKDVDDAIVGGPCTCPDGSTGYWGNSSGGTAGSPAPEAFREIHGQ